MDKRGSRAELFAVSDLDENTETEYTVIINGKTIAKGKKTAVAGQSIFRIVRRKRAEIFRDPLEDRRRGNGTKSFFMRQTDFFLPVV